VAGGSGPGTRTVRREVVLERGGRSGVGDEGVDGWQVGCAYERARSAARLRGKKERRGGGGSAVGVPHGAGAVMGPGPDRVPACHDPDAARAGGASLFGP
jgi:hypothetical protein